MQFEGEGYGEWVYTADEFKWDQLSGLPSFDLSEADLEDSALCLGQQLAFSSAQIVVEKFSDADDMVSVIITGAVMDEAKQTHRFRASSWFYLVRKSKHAKSWQEKIVLCMVRSFPNFTFSRHYTEASDYGLRYGDEYFSEFIGPRGEVILIQLEFDSPDLCKLYVCRPFQPMVSENDRRFIFDAAGFEEMSVFIQQLTNE
ncbi:MAG: hypothetical protein AAF585_19135 [Verrucomicrobiota bacterium]